MYIVRIEILFVPADHSFLDHSLRGPFISLAYRFHDDRVKARQATANESSCQQANNVMYVCIGLYIVGYGYLLYIGNRPKMRVPKMLSKADGYRLKVRQMLQERTVVLSEMFVNSTNVLADQELLMILTGRARRYGVVRTTAGRDVWSGLRNNSCCALPACLPSL